MKLKSKKASKKDLAGAGEEPATSSHLVDAGMCLAHFIFLLIDLIQITILSPETEEAS